MNRRSLERSAQILALLRSYEPTRRTPSSDPGLSLEITDDAGLARGGCGGPCGGWAAQNRYPNVDRVYLRLMAFNSI